MSRSETYVIFCKSINNSLRFFGQIDTMKWLQHNELSCDHAFEVRKMFELKEYAHLKASLIGM